MCFLRLRRRPGAFLTLKNQTRLSPVVLAKRFLDWIGDKTAIWSAVILILRVLDESAFQQNQFQMAFKASISSFYFFCMTANQIIGCQDKTLKIWIDSLFNTKSVGKWKDVTFSLQAATELKIEIDLKSQTWALKTVNGTSILVVPVTLERLCLVRSGDWTPQTDCSFLAAVVLD